MIDDEARARQLARAICAEVMLSNAAVKDAPPQERAGLLSAPMGEGRELYASRASPRLGWIFDAAVAELVAGPLGIEPAALSVWRPPAPRTSLANPVLPQASGGKGLTLAVLAILSILAALFFFTR